MVDERDLAQELTWSQHIDGGAAAFDPDVTIDDQEEFLAGLPFAHEVFVVGDVDLIGKLADESERAISRTGE